MKRMRVASRGVEDWRAGLAAPERQWQAGRSAYELARSWQDAAGFPPAVKAAFAEHPLLPDAELLLGLPEYRVPTPGRGHASQVDLLVLARSRADGLVVIAVEGKGSESFGPTLAAWRRENTANRQTRLRGLCEELGLDCRLIPDDLRYQLLHRAASAVMAARSFGSRHAVLLVHSFSATRRGYPDFARFAALLGVEAAPGRLSSPVHLNGVDLALGWVADRVADRP
jgi:hypothetical protein